MHTRWHFRGSAKPSTKQIDTSGWIPPFFMPLLLPTHTSRSSPQTYTMKLLSTPGKMMSTFLLAEATQIAIVGDRCSYDKLIPTSCVYIYAKYCSTRITVSPLLTSLFFTLTEKLMLMEQQWISPLWLKLMLRILLETTVRSPDGDRPMVSSK